MAGFDLYQLFVNEIFGNIFLSMFGIMFIMLITGILGRMDIKSIVIINVFFMGVFLVGYIGALASVPLFMGASYYFFSGLINWINNMRT